MDALNVRIENLQPMRVASVRVVCFDLYLPIED